MGTAKELDKLISLHEELKCCPQGKIGDAEKYFSNLQLLPGQFAYIIDIARGEIAGHKGFDSFLGYRPEEVNLHFLYTMFHPDEAEMMQAIVARAWQTLLPLKLKPFELQFSLDYRIRKANGEYIRVFRQSTNAETDDRGTATVTLSLCSDITHIKNNGPVSYQWQGTGDQTMDILDLINAKLVHLSRREIELLRLLAEGYSSDRAAEKLNISAHTVSTHRKNMLRRTNLNSTVELIIYAIRYKLI